MDTISENAKQGPRLNLLGSRQFNSWLLEMKASLAFTTYQTGKLFLIGLQTDGRLSVFERTFNRCMGLCSTSNGLLMSSLYQLWQFENCLTPGELHNGYDALYVPQTANTTGDVDIHDIAVDGRGEPVFVNTLFGCLATVSKTHSFKSLWQPSFLSKLVPEDRCHLNGLAMRDGKPRYVTAVSTSDAADGWRDNRISGGVVLDVETNEILAEGLSMPHSPRWHNEKLWILNSGKGEFGYVDLTSRKFEPVAFCPGYLRGLSFIGDFAVVGLSLPRNNKTFSGLPLDAMLQEKKVDARCGLQVIDLKTGAVVHWLRLEGVVEELYDVVVLPGVQRPMAIGLKSDEIRRTLSVEPSLAVVDIVQKK